MSVTQREAMVRSERAAIRRALNGAMHGILAGQKWDRDLHRAAVVQVMALSQFTVAQWAMEEFGRAGSKEGVE